MPDGNVVVSIIRSGRINRRGSKSLWTTCWTGFHRPPIADILFHEVGHHLDLSLVSPGRGGELPANEWRKQLSRALFRKRYWYLVPIVKPIWKVIGPGINKWINQKIAARRR